MIEPDQHPPQAANRRTQEAQASNAALRLLAIRPRTVDEMRQRLATRFGAAAAEKTIPACKPKGCSTTLTSPNNGATAASAANPAARE